MVNHGTSHGCATCKQRRVKCDETKPQCMECLRLGRECKGYAGTRGAVKVRFRDQTAKYSGKRPAAPTTAVWKVTTPSKVTSPSKVTTPSKPARAGNYDFAILRSPPPYQQDHAIPFLLTYVADFGRSADSSRGFMEFVRPALAAERHDSALHAAVGALAAKIWALLRRGEGAPSPPDGVLGRALVRLRAAVDDPAERDRDETVLAALVLELHEMLSAVFGQHRARGTHRDGASALILQRRADAVGSRFYGNLVANMLHSKVSMCVRERIPFPASDLEWLSAQSIPTSPSSMLDIIGISVANLQSQFGEPPAKKEQLPSLELVERYRHLRGVEDQLQAWLQVLPQHWHPRRMLHGKGTASVRMYKGACDLYPNVQIASLWNVWRIYRLILVQAKLQLAADVAAFPTKNEEYMGDILDSILDSPEAQEIVDSVCHSVPFYLGNRTTPSSLYDMESPELRFPSYHDLPPDDEAFLSYKDSKHYMSASHHSRHAVLQGPWRIMGILAHLVGLFSDERSALVTQALRQEQRDWISEQFLRALHLQRLLPQASLHASGIDDNVQSRKACVASQIERAAGRVKQGLRMMDIL